MKEYKYKINGNTYNVAIGDIDNGLAQVEVNGVPYKVELEDKSASVKVAATPKPSAAPRTSTGEKVIASRPAAGGAGTPVKSPLPGVIMSINVNVGDTVKASDTVIVLEAMKMENSIQAGRDGVVASIDIKSGDSVLEGTTLLTIS
ncbi:MAG: acetyl-CoA carboxylase biotin carboxyl carrier protein subunit [Clostridiales bacterium]|nr:acetyl-CoA carboxylase biotin carboxyl carrier protein subunit [Clostridiales bacterium]